MARRQPFLFVARFVVAAFFFSFSVDTDFLHAQQPSPDVANKQTQQPLSYNADIRPILATNCFPCHGPDEATRAADLRLDSLQGATADLGGYPAITPGSLADSELVERIEESDPDLRMPPADSNKTLTVEQIQVLREWIESGADYQAHWSFVAPQKSALPDVDAKRFPVWAEHAIDRFVLQKMLNEGLSPAPPAAPRTLIRRLYLDLVGLPPTTDESERWNQELTMPPLGLSGFNEAAYAALVDELLASPHYGERWARRWLDLARYADTNGYEKDRARNIWPFRDWVIKSFNRDLPFDQFTIQQLAGDLLPETERDHLVATGFHRNTMLNEEGGIDPLEYRFYAMTDRVATTGTTWLGLTLGCAQCHTHKYDPVTHSDYYQIMAILNNADEPDLELTSPADIQHQRERLAEAERLIAELPGHWPIDDAEKPGAESNRQQSLEAAFQNWLQASRANTPSWQSLRPTTATSATLRLTTEPDDSIFVSGDITKDDLYTLTFSNVAAGTSAIRLEVLPDERLPGRGPGMAYFEGPKGDFFLGELTASIETTEGLRPLAFGNVSETYTKNNFGGDSAGARFALDGDPQTGWSCAGQSGQQNVAVFNLAEPLPALSSITITLRFGRHYPCSLGRFRISTTAKVGDVVAQGTEPLVETLLSLPESQLSVEQQTQLRNAFLLQATELKEQSDRIRELRQRPSVQTTLVMRERPVANPRPTFRHHRGEFLQPKEEVTPGVPDFLPTLNLQSGTPPRLAFARWLVARENPLTQRVQVNRAWSALFGKGLVGTEGDFGLQGEPPSHPELLDWLAVEFVEQGQSVKRLHRVLVMTATYQQSSATTALQQRHDPQNRYLSHANRTRLEAEQVRDLVLTASSLLNPQQFGPPVHPPQPEGATETAYGGAGWNASTGPDRYRRGIYTFLKRTAPYSMFNTFDAPTGEFCLAQREVSNTALQALTLLNDTVISEAAENLGVILESAGGSDGDRITALFQRCLSRPASAEEIDRVIHFVETQRTRIEANELKFIELIPNVIKTHNEQASKQTDTEVNEEQTLRQKEIAVWAITARAILNLDETITKN